MLSFRLPVLASSVALFAAAASAGLDPATPPGGGDSRTNDPAFAPDTSGLPRLETRGAATQLIVDGKPFLVLGGELHNSSSSSLEYMRPVWQRLAAMHLNTVVLPVAWETIEPSEGAFDFSVVDGLLAGARASNLRLVVLWFGAWKNTFSSYAPAWVKTDTERFPRVQTSDGRDTERLSPFSAAVEQADARAFARLMAHLRQADGQRHTVLMVQVENEIGVVGQSRDHSAVADAAFAGPVPPALTAYLMRHRLSLDPEFRANWDACGAWTSGTWQEVFGSSPLTDDLFMAWHFATYVEGVARAGQAQYSLPLYVNAALIRPNYEPGQYNSGGPLPHSFDVWRAGAPTINLLSPDIYFNEFAYWAGAYKRPGNPLFIPEAQGGPTGAANALYAFGHLSAIGFSPFGIDDEGNTPLDLVGITRAGERPDNTAIAGAFGVLSHLAPMILDHQARGGLYGVLLEGDAQRGGRVALGEYLANVSRPLGATGTRIGVLFLRTGPGEFLVAGAGGDARITFSTDRPGPPIVGILSTDEMYFEHGGWAPRRRLNGDENSQGNELKLFARDLDQGRIYRVRLYRYR
jgi:hypothetical protein